MNRNATATILIVLAIGIYFTFTRGLWNEVKAVQQVNNQYTTALTNAEQLIKVREQVLKSYNNLSQDNRVRLDKMIPNTVDNIRLIIDLNSVAVRHGFALSNIKAVTAASTERSAAGTGSAVSARSRTVQSTQVAGIANPTLDTVSVTFGVTAPYLEFISFLQDLEANLRIMDISRLTVSADDTGLYNFQIELKTYWLRQ
jgi:hypothetical protein